MSSFRELAERNSASSVACQIARRILFVLARDRLGQFADVIRIDSRFRPGARDRDVEDVLSRGPAVGLSLDKDTISAQSLGAVDRRRISMIEVKGLVGR